ncbi:hypothetical protein [Streptomyces noursei]|nr:hypothetical protein [Streptomyces noursei]UWS77549.1 hypothetical protein N1H47_40795 [Streptomyces noursei]UWS77588.1 hypothetical protein N1H47_40595 [Streptomyces noursei]
MTTPSDDATSAFLRRAEEINQRRMAAVEPLAELVAQRTELRRQLDALEETYGRQYVEAEKAGWTEEELTAMDAAPPVRRPRGRPAKKNSSRRATKAEKAAPVPSQQPRNDAQAQQGNPAATGAQ